MEIADIIIVGSGIAGASAASALCNAGKNIVMLDVGNTSEYKNNIIADFETIRTQNADIQSDFFLGKDFEALQFSKNKNAPQLTPQRQFITRLTKELLPIQSNNFAPVESLALGGLGNAWGLGAYTFSEEELKKCGLPINEIKQSYQHEINRIGVSGNTKSDAAPFCYNQEFPIQKPLALNEVSKHLLEQYNKHKKGINKKGVYLGNSSLALLSEDKPERKAYNYNDTDFYNNVNESAYRPDFVIKKLIATKKLNYINNCLVQSFEEQNEITIIKAIDTNTKQNVAFRCRKLILACGTLNTARIVLKSYNSNAKLPILCNAYNYLPMLYLPYLGKKNNTNQFGLAQLNLFYDKVQNHSEVVMASLYNYRSLLHFRMAQQMPLGIKNNFELLQLIIPSLFIAGIFYPANYNDNNFIQLNNDGVLISNYDYSENELQHNKQSLKAIKSVFRSLKCMPLQTVNTTAGASIHYAGSLPFSKNPEKFKLATNGKLHDTKNIFVADASGFTFLPGKGLSLTIMANAHFVANNCLREL
ncbi:GMC oxidoreductase [Flavobacterium sp.]|uniref:GMC oxidoreductase n=1 Tax=Flavobacterium sp. TaxID=239 RepID=UPI0032657AA7